MNINIFTLIRYFAMFVSIACIVLGLIKFQSPGEDLSKLFFVFLIIGPLVNIKESFKLTIFTTIGYIVMVVCAFEINYSVFAVDSPVNVMLLWLAYLFGFFISDFS
jgi:hypothetical protein